MATPTAPLPALVRAARAVLILCLLPALAGCGGERALPAPEAAERYPAVVDELADTLSTEISPLSSDGDAPQVSTDSEGCRMTGASFESEDLLGDSDEDAPDTTRIAEVTDVVLAQHGFDDLAPEDDDPRPMEILVARDEDGGTVRVVIESRPGRPTLRLWWSARIETDGAPCDQALLG